MAKSGWDAYVERLTAHGVADTGAILGLSGSQNSVDPDYMKLSEQEIRVIVGVVNQEPDMIAYAQANGVYAAGKKYFFTSQNDDGSFYVRNGQEGLAVGKSTTCAVLAHHTQEKSTAGQLAMTVKETVDVLKGYNM